MSCSTNKGRGLQRKAKRKVGASGFLCSRSGHGKHPADNSGKTQTGKASYYSHKFAGKKMANGAPMDPNSNNAASKTLPLGTKARVTNMRNGKSAVVVIKDRGPHMKGRIIDLSPATAKTIGAGKQGVVPVQVTPIEAPHSGGKGKP